MNTIDNPSGYLEKALGLIFNDDTIEAINGNASIINFSAGDIVLHEGEKSTCAFLILSGMVIGYYIDKQGNDITKCFSKEGEFFSTEGLRTGEASSFTIECLENCKCIRLPYDLVHKLSRQDDKVNNLLNQYYSIEVSKLEERTKNQILLSAEERYSHFCEQYSHIQSRIALRYIASYIGIRAASLSRIRRNFTKKDST